MFDFDGDGDIDEFDEELAEYELQLMEDEILFEEEERRGSQRTSNENEWGKSCGLGMLITIGIIIIVFIVLLGI